MKEFSKLTHLGQVRRLRQLALNALEHYPIALGEISLIQHVYNTLFRIETADGTPYALRINAPGIRSLSEIRAEMTWLAALTRDTDLHVPSPLATKHGDLAVTAEAEGVPEPRHCVIFSWVGGRHFKRQPPTALIYQMGLSLAKLHDHADHFSPPADFSLKRLDQVWPFGVPDQIYGQQPDELFTPERRTLFQAAAKKVETTLATLYRDTSGLRVLHADLHLGNVKVERGALQIFDFDDCAWGFPVQDIGISLYYLQYNPNFAELRQTFLTGYTSHRTLPTHYDVMETLIVARELAVINFVIQSNNPQLRQYAPHFVGAAERRLQAWSKLDT